MKSFRTQALIAALALSAFASCTSPQMKAALDEREQDNRALREERSSLKGQNRDLSSQNASLETALAEANARLLEEPTRQEGQRFGELDEAGVGYGIRDGRMVISIPQELTFASGKSDLSNDGRKALKAVAKTLQENYADAEYWIEGHTDNDPIVKSKFASNRDLSIARAMAVLHYLVDDAGMADGQCVVAAWGPYRPVASNDTKANKSKNRRVE